MTRLLLAALLLATPAWAQVIDVPSTPHANVPDYGVTVSIAAIDNPVGTMLHLRERSNAVGSQWIGFANTAPELGTIAASIANAGGPAQYVIKKLPEINAALAKRYPPIGTPLPVLGDPVSQINAALGNLFQITVVGGVVALGTK